LLSSNDRFEQKVRLASKADSTGDNDGAQDAAVGRLVLVRVGSSDRQALLVKKKLEISSRCEALCAFY
jgi:hypothetical protein